MACESDPQEEDLDGEDPDDDPNNEDEEIPTDPLHS